MTVFIEEVTEPVVDMKAMTVDIKAIIRDAVTPVGSNVTVMQTITYYAVAVALVEVRVARGSHRSSDCGRGEGHTIPEVIVLMVIIESVIVVVLKVKMTTLIIKAVIVVGMEVRVPGIIMDEV
ncbi:hypothetical protein QAD02_019426 [Eretmocerus hayati]|uniref:Uncharacterized protein n=1 Tax=Eretmocerus hayati TaxID=131215 RepID=A0ACC2PJ83_9HYME|nr:hypothetical protein QAD02_019426 [Eretmocerus hayati]